MQMDQLQSPFTWKSRILPEAERIHRVDKLPLAPSTWAKVLLKLSLAYTEYRAGNHEKALALMTECYIPLLPACGLLSSDSFDSGCNLVQDYSLALKHVLDSTWAFMRRHIYCDDSGDDVYSKYLSDFVSTIPSFKDMDRNQKAAVYAIRAFLSKAPKNLEFIRKAISLNDKEGQWHCALGKLLLMNRIPKTAHYPGRPSSQEEIRAFGDAYRLRKDPESCTLLAESWLDNGPNGHSIAATIIRDALQRFPDSASVQARSARVLWLLPAPQLELVEACYRRALKLTGECLFLRFKLGGLCVIVDKLEEAREHYRRAAAIYPEAEEVLTSLNRLPLLRVANANQLLQQQRQQLQEKQQLKQQLQHQQQDTSDSSYETDSSSSSGSSFDSELDFAIKPPPMIVRRETAGAGRVKFEGRGRGRGRGRNRGRKGAG